MTVKCFYCSETFSDYTALAIHISQIKKGHRKGKRWAAKHLMLNTLSPNKKRKQNDRIPLTAEDRENKESAKRALSGAIKTMITYCPKCKDKSKQSVPIEYNESSDAWRTDKGILVMVCPQCQSVHSKTKQQVYR